MSEQILFSRFDFLHMARDILESQSRAKLSKRTNGVEPYGQEVITTEQIIAEAAKIEAFVRGTAAHTIVGNVNVVGDVNATGDVRADAKSVVYAGQPNS